METTTLATHLAHIALEACLAPAEYLRSATRSGTAFTTKADLHDPVTVHDRAVEDALHRLLCAAVPGSRVLGEEAGERVLDGVGPALVDIAPTPASPRWYEGEAACRELGARVRWIVDPIDGTASFAAGLPWFCTTIAAELDGQIVAGAVVAPMLREAWAADLEEAWYEAGQSRRRLDARGVTHESQALLICYHPGPKALAKDPETAADQEFRLANAHQTLRRYGAAALDLAMVASGWCGGMMGFTFGPWDVAAGIHMLRVAGGTAENLNVKGDQPDGLRSAVLAAGAGLDLVTARQVFHEVVHARQL